MSHIEENLKLLRRFNKYKSVFSQKDISKMSGISQTHISRLENNIEHATLTDIIFYSKFFKVSTDDIIFKKYNQKTKKFKVI